MTFNFLGPGLTVNVEAKVKEQIILDSSELMLLFGGAVRLWNVVEQANRPSGAFAHPTILSLLEPISKHYNELKHRLTPSKN